MFDEFLGAPGCRRDRSRAALNQVALLREFPLIYPQRTAGVIGDGEAFETLRRLYPTPVAFGVCGGGICLTWCVGCSGWLVVVPRSATLLVLRPKVEDWHPVLK